MSTDWHSMRASDADRERAADVLKAALAEGRLDWGEHHDRVDAVMEARTYGELAELIADLPVGPTPFPIPQQQSAEQLPAAQPAQAIPPTMPFGGIGQHPGQPRLPGVRGMYPGALPGALPGTHPVNPGYPANRLPPAPPAPLANPWANYVPAPVRATEPLAKVSVACAVLGLCTTGMSAVPAIVTGHLALARIRRTNGDGIGLAVTGLILGYLELAVVALVFVLSVVLGLGR
ncbi:DUF1707 and DUF4190 domain-containing protein [Actinopolymorpha rutila]|uniref:DUF4190 domain-containing protein n=1 Tax=Actinopolymorpha rutila TaxID=446787 RepID=A0A852ZHP1_9ACTN|nr:DUF1707 and DUF4190 domain-containing protein [Actinopolymorpha rutila]NYH92651.1 hypothetical protein [Actinopolymorpha rutila]